MIITFWQYRNACATAPGLGCYNVRDPLDLALIAAATAGACIGFLWWNAAPAKIFMGDTGSLALGGMIAGLSVTSRTELLAVVIGALFVAEIVVGRRADPGVPHHRPPGVPDGAVPPPFRARRLGGDHGDHQVLAARGHRLRPGRRPCSTASGFPRSAPESDAARISSTLAAGARVLVVGAGVTGARCWRP